MSKIEMKKNTILIAGEVEIYPEADMVSQVFGVEEKKAIKIMKCVKALHTLEDSEAQVILKLAEKFIAPNEFLYAVWFSGMSFEIMKIKGFLAEAGVPIDFL